MLVGPSLIIIQQTTVAAPTTKLSTWPCHFNFSHIFFAFPHACVAYHTKISSFSSLLPRATNLKYSLLWEMSRMKTVTLREEKLELDIPSPMKLSPAFRFALCCSPGQQGLSLPYLSDPQRIIGHYMGSKHDRNKCTAIKKKIHFFWYENQQQYTGLFF